LKDLRSVVCCLVVHELAITESVVEAVVERVAGARVGRVVMEVGKLCAVVPDALQFCFDLCAQGTSLEGATLEILAVPARATCATCHTEFDIDHMFGVCACGSADLSFVGGDQLRIREVEVI
jgi:hydrogenase nickel incorporation protein HypA/HybF